MPTATDARRLVLGAAVGFQVDQVRIFVESLRASGYTGDVAILIGLTDVALATYLHQHGVMPKRTWFIRRFHGPIHAYRFQLFTDYLRAHRDRYDEVLISDVRDVAFQAHPFADITSPAVHYFLEGDNRTIGNEPTNMVYARLFLPESDVERLKPCRISCCGVVLGGMAAMTAYLDRMNADLAAVPMKVRRKIGADTAFHNHMGHLTKDFPVEMVENNVHVATMGIEPASTYRIGADGAVRTASGTLPAILHQYDRLPEIKSPVEARWLKGR
ncbi:MAG TPA: hypothetical protein VM867_07525 [Xanthobacteraceae bacterium]|nr:hypothetical protein [Xanthobacteraceae bacterium]